MPTGYGIQSAIFTNKLRNLGHDVAVSVYWGLAGAGLDWDGVRIYPADEDWGNRTLAASAAHHAGGNPADCQVITLMDVYVLRPEKMPPRIASWCPVDHKPVSPPVVEFFTKSRATPIAMSRFGEDEMREAGLDPLYVPHGYDRAHYQPRSASRRREIREQADIPADAFVVGMVAANKGQVLPRKAFPQVFQAFSQLHRWHSDSFLYVHADAFSPDGVNLRLLALACKIPLDRIRFTDPFNLHLGIDPDSLADLYSSLDVLANPSFGEGFGIPIIEAQACGTPVVVTDWSAMPELCGAGWKVGGERWYDASQDAWFMCPSVEQIADTLQDAYDKAGGLRDQAAEFAQAYDADLVTDHYWKPALAKLEGWVAPEVRPIREVAA